MGGIFPNLGKQDEERCRQLPGDAERDYLRFCLEFCGLILDSRPGHAEALQIAAQYFTALGCYSDGLEMDRRLAAIFPDDPGVLYNLSCSLALTGDREGALAQLSRAVERGYRDFRHMLEDKDLASIRDDPRFGEILKLPPPPPK